MFGAKYWATCVGMLWCAAVLCATPTALCADPVGESIDSGVVRFFADSLARQKAEPSYSLQKPVLAIGPVPDGFPLRPVFTRDELGEVVTITIAPNTSLYGTGMIFGNLLLNGQQHNNQPTYTWNFDAYGYGDWSANLYESHPWVLGVRADGTAFGVLADTTYPVSISTQSTAIQFSMPKVVGYNSTGTVFMPPVDVPYPVIIIDRKSPQEVIVELAKLTGYMPMPPKWALGYHQSHFSYTPGTLVLDIAKKFRKEHIPCDSVWMDIDYMDHYRIFSFNPSTFPNPQKLNSSLAKMGFHNVWMIDPAVRTESQTGVTAVFDTGTANDVWVKQSSGQVFHGFQWPHLDPDPSMRTTSVFPDFTSPSVRRWWASRFPSFLSHGVDGVWNDMDEPALFTNDNWKTMPLDNVHKGDPELVNATGLAQGVQGALGNHLRYHNVYGMLTAQGTRNGLLLARPDRRPFVLSRANFIGGQRYAAAWTGDNTANPEHLELSIPMILNLSLSGQPFAGPDLGGYRFDVQQVPSGTKIATNEDAAKYGEQQHAEDAHRYARWMGFGALFPFCRGHYEKGYPWSKEPFSFEFVDSATTTTCRLALQRRYRLIPYIYTLFHEAATMGMPVVRSIFFADTADLDLRSCDHSFLLGADILVSASISLTDNARDKMPRGIWEKFAFPTQDTDRAEPDSQDKDLPQLYLRGGAIVPSGPIMQYIDEKSLQPLTLLVCLDTSGKASGTFYEDAGDGWDFLKGAYRLTHYSAKLMGNRVIVTRQKLEGKFHIAPRRVDVRLFYRGKEYAGTGLDGGDISLRIE